MLKKIAVTAALTASVLLSGIQTAVAEYPESPVQFVVPWPPGDFEDILTRMIAKVHRLLISRGVVTDRFPGHLRF